jgi:uncharacterized alpha-E superfamily protein
MLGKTAGGLFWMFRYLERAENTARLIEAGQRIALTRPDGATTNGARAADGRVWPGYQRAWRRSARKAIDWMLRDKDNPSSVLSAIAAARRTRGWCARR